jgi:hypothetical protein
MIRCSPVESTFICSVAAANQSAGKLLLFDIKTKKLEVSCMLCAGGVGRYTLCLQSISVLHTDAFLSNHRCDSYGSSVLFALVVQMG